MNSTSIEACKAPCKGCTERKIIGTKSCHSWCEKYLSWVKAQQDLKHKIIEKNKIDKDSYSVRESMYIRKGCKKI